MKRLGRKKSSKDDQQDNADPPDPPDPDENQASQTGLQEVVEEEEQEQEQEQEKEPEEKVPGQEEPGPSEENVDRKDDDAARSSHQPQGLRGQVEQFRPHRLSNPSVVPSRVTVETPKEPEEVVSEVQQKRKPSPSAYAMLQEADSIAYLKNGATSQMDNIEAGALNEELSDMSGYNLNTEPLAQPSTIRRRRWRKFKKYVYNSENNTYCTRTISGWCAICHYYFWVILIFLAVFMIYILTFIWRDTDGSPAFLKMAIMDHPNPGLAIVPLDPDQSDMVIWDKSGRAGSARHKKYLRDIANYLGKSDLACHQQKLLKQKCDFNLEDFGPCAKHPCGYDEKKPCIFLKLNNLLTWMPTPIPINAGQPPGTTPELWKKIKEDSSSSPRHCVYVDCQGATLYDKGYLGKIEYYPEPAFDIKFFPATRETTTNPTIAMKLNEIKPGHILTIHCTLLAGNIKDKENSNIKLTVYVD